MYVLKISKKLFENSDVAPEERHIYRICQNKWLGCRATAYFYAVATELEQFLQISGYNYDVSNGTREFSNSFLEVCE